MSTTPDKLVERYLKHLEVELDDLPRDRRREIVDEIAGHIAEARAGLGETEADVRNILEGVGDPAEIAADARERFDVQPRKSGFHEIAALILLLIGGFVIPFVGWFVGLALLWASSVWSIRDKVIGTVFVPGGLMLPIGLMMFGGEGSSGGRLCEVDPATAREFNCTEFGGDSTSFMDVLTIVVIVALLITPIITTAYLGYRLRRRPAAAAV